jgi:coenzyme Q-binding protein COQ10
MFRERFTSIVKLDRASHRIDVSYAEGPFRYLNNHWKFLPEGGHHTRVDFFVDFEFRSALLQKVIGVLFNEAVRRMVTAFEHRALTPGSPAVLAGRDPRLSG